MNAARTATLGERKCALLLASLHASDRRALLARLPVPIARTIRQLVAELARAPLPAADVAQALLADEMLGLTPDTTLQVEELLRLSRSLSPAWFARVLTAWTGVDHAFCLALVEPRIAAEVRAELQRIAALPPRLSDALKAQAMQLVQGGSA